jgi:hypothetical protein
MALCEVLRRGSCRGTSFDKILSPAVRIKMSFTPISDSVENSGSEENPSLETTLEQANLQRTKVPFLDHERSECAAHGDSTFQTFPGEDQTLLVTREKTNTDHASNMEPNSVTPPKRSSMDGHLVRILNFAVIIAVNILAVNIVTLKSAFRNALPSRKNWGMKLTCLLEKLATFTKSFVWMSCNHQFFQHQGWINSPGRKSTLEEQKNIFHMGRNNPIPATNIPGKGRRIPPQRMTTWGPPSGVWLMTLAVLLGRASHALWIGQSTRYLFHLIQ